MTGEYESLYFIADYHALTTARDPEQLAQRPPHFVRLGEPGAGQRSVRVVALQPGCGVEHRLAMAGDEIPA